MGPPYLLWKADANAIGQTSQLFAQRLRPDGLALTGERGALLRSDAGWEQPLIENPALLAADGAYILLYSGGWWESGGYATGYAICDTPLGPCDKETTDQPILASAGDEAGTGGARVITRPRRRPMARLPRLETRRHDSVISFASRASAESHGACPGRADCSSARPSAATAGRTWSSLKSYRWAAAAACTAATIGPQSAPG